MEYLELEDLSDELWLPTFQNSSIDKKSFPNFYNDRDAFKDRKAVRYLPDKE